MLALLKKIFNQIDFKLELHTIAFYTWLFPVILFNLILLLRHPSLTTLFCLVSGIVCSLFYNNLLAGFDTLHRYNIVRTGYLEKFKQCIYKPYTLEDYISEENIEKTKELNSSSYANRANIPVLSGVFDESLHIYAVKKDRSSICPNQLTSYMIPFDASYIFIRDEPDSIKPIGRYFIHHEIGHTLFTAARHQVRILYGNRTIILFAVWFLLTAQWNLETALIEVLLILAATYVSFQYRQSSQKSRLEDEVWADNFAISSLSENDKKKLLSFFSKYPFPADSALSDEQNKSRSEYLLKNLQSSLENKKINVNDKFPEIFAYDNASQAYSLLSVYISAALIFFIALVAPSPTTSSLIKSTMFVTLPITMLLLIVAVRCTFAKIRIENLLLARQN